MEAKTNTIIEKEKPIGHERILYINFNQDQGNLIFYDFLKGNF